MLYYWYIYHQYTPNVSIYSIHGSYGVLRCIKPPMLGLILTYLTCTFAFSPELSSPTCVGESIHQRRFACHGWNVVGR